MTSDEEMIRFHNGDTLDSIPIVRIPEPERPRLPWRVITATLAVALGAGTAVGLVLASQDGPIHTVATDPSTPSTAVSSSDVTSETPSPRVTVTTVVTTTPPTPQPEAVPTEAEDSYVQQAPYADVNAESVYISQVPATGGDPSTDYCLNYTDGSAVLMAEAPKTLCHDFLFSTHPSDGQGVFETVPPLCATTPGGRLAQLYFDPSTMWSDDGVYTCLLLNDQM